MMNVAQGGLHFEEGDEPSGSEVDWTADEEGHEEEAACGP